MSSEEPLAHSAKKDKGIPAQTYVDHIAGVLRRAYKNVSHVDFLTGYSVLIDMVHSTSILHDLGKLT